jgi:hypothetical protein
MKKINLIALVLTLALPVALIAGCSSSTTTTSVTPVATTFVFTTQPAGATAGTAFTTQPVVSVTDDYGNVDTGYTGAVTLAITSGTGASGATLSGTTTVTAIDGVATFTDLSIDTAGTGYSLTATSGSLLYATSDSFDVAAVTPVATTFVFTTQPAGATAGAAFTTQPVVSVVDANGNVVTGFTGAVTLAITSGTGVSETNLSGTLTVNAVNGVATFTDLSIDTAGSGYSLTATSGSLTSVSSNPFDVAAATSTATS